MTFGSRQNLVSHNSQDSFACTSRTSSYIYVANDPTGEDEIKFEAIRVVQGTTDNGFSSVKLIDAIPDKMKIVTEEAYYVFAQSKAGELEHEH